MVKGHFFYKDLRISQADNIKKYFEELLLTEKFDAIFEIGTASAGLTIILYDIIQENNLLSRLETLDIRITQETYNCLISRNITYHKLDERSDGFDVLLKSFINQYKKVLILCDGGNKSYEFNKISYWIKLGDFIMAHDYCSNDNKWLSIKDKIWNWREIDDNMISLAVYENNLQKYKKIDFQQVVWCCLYKSKIKLFA